MPPVIAVLHKPLRIEFAESHYRRSRSPTHRLQLRIVLAGLGVTAGLWLRSKVRRREKLYASNFSVFEEIDGFDVWALWQRMKLATAQALCRRRFAGHGVS